MTQSTKTKTAAKTALSLALVCAASALSAPALAKSTDYTRALQFDSLAWRQQGAGAVVLERVAGPTGRAVEARFLATLASRPQATFLMPANAQRRDDGERIVYASPLGHLDIGVDGTSLRYARSNVAPDPTVKELSPAEIDAPARAVIADRLAGIVELADDERLVLVDVQPRVFETFDTRTRVASRYVEATRATYAVEKRGLVILSNIVSVELRRADEIVGVSVRLERFKVSARPLTLASQATMAQRVRVAAIDLAAPAQDERLESFLCGYLSSGVAVGGELEPVCVAEYTVTRGDAKSGYSVTIPMAATPILDAAVPMTRYLAERGEPADRAAYRAALGTYKTR